MQVTKTSIFDALLLKPNFFKDERGFFFESWNKKNLMEIAGINEDFVQDNHSKSFKGVLRGMHYQLEKPQGKLVRVTLGRILDVIVDIRMSSPTFGQHYSVELNDQNHLQLWVPPGIAHGFLVLSDEAELLYKTTDYYAPELEQTILWNDFELGIDWKINDATPIVSLKDKEGVAFKDAIYFD
jgi:dTDP-4-dehydrorhamnose 3,5-epimerase